MKYLGIVLFFFIISFTGIGQEIFSEQSANAGIANLGFNYSISLADYDSDGDEDIYITRLADKNLLYQNQGNGQFKEVAAEAGVDYEGVTYMAVWGDIDNDEDLDLYLANEKNEPNILYINDGQGKFTDGTSEAGVEFTQKSRTVLMADVDNDGWLDIYLANNGAQNSLFHNNADGTFTDIITSSRAVDQQIAMGAIFFDYDNDNDQDLYLIHDGNQANILYRNEGNNKFTDVSESAGVAYEGLGMGVDAADLNNDGFLDLYITNMLENVLYLNNGDGTFKDISEAASVDDDGMGWGTTWIDYDNDGLRDLYLSNDSDFFPNPNILYRNNGDFTFQIVSENTVIESPNEGYATACGDINGDGWPDLLVANTDTNNQLFINEGSGKHWIKIRLRGTESNTYAVGARVEVHTANGISVDEVTTGSGYSAQNSFTLHFGLNDQTSINKVVVRWPSGLVETFEDLKPDTYYVIKENLWIRHEADSRLEAGFQDISSSANIEAIGRNNGVAIADFDNDGDEDIYISRLVDNVNLLYENRGNGKFLNAAPAAGLSYEGITVTSIWGDINNDGYKDLYLGNQNAKDQLFLNNGDKTFTDITAEARINNDQKPNSVNMADIDNDGDLDIYVANIFSENILYRNNGDLTFTDITRSSGATDRNVAMGAIFFDYDNDFDVDLLLTNDGFSEYVMYENDGTGKFSDVSEASGLNYPGQGMGVDVADYNNDGLLDVYVTNLLENVLMQNNGDKTFTNVSEIAGIGDLGMGWGIVWVDYNNDGFQDIYIANDSNFSPYSNKLYHNKGNGEFIEISQDSPLHSFYGGYGSAIADFNMDGGMDIFLANLNGAGNQLFMNTAPENNWIKFKVRGTTSNADGIGAKVQLKVGESYYIDEVHAGSGYASQSSSLLHFGIGQKEMVEELTITWPGGFQEIYPDLEANQYYLLTENVGIEIINIVTALENEINAEELFKVYPNPFVDEVHFNFLLKSQSKVKLRIMDMSGRLIQSLLNELLPAGSHQLGWRTNSLRNGVYLVTYEIEDRKISRLLIKD